jgi:Mrp family chromosome partitioning ATPase
MREVLAALSEQVDILVLDSPPVLAVADAAILASQADRVLMVVDARLTRRKLAQQALEGLERVDAPVLGAVLNRVPASGASYPYYHYYARAVPSDSERTGQRGRWRKERAPRSIGQQGVVATASSQGSE